MSWTRTWISHDTWMWPWTTCMRILLSLSMEMFVNPTCTTVLILFLIGVASATKIDFATKLNADIWINSPSQLRRIYLPTVWWDNLDPSKLILIKSPCDFFHSTKYVFFRLMDEWVECWNNHVYDFDDNSPNIPVNMLLCHAWVVY